MEGNKAKIHLRPFKESDWEAYLSWHTNKIKWMEYDAPWEEDESTEIEDIKKEFKLQLEISNRETPSRLAISLQNGKAIGSVNRYITDSKLAIGIGICDDDYWGMGLGKEAFQMWIDFWNQKGEKDIYCETWSGNERMIKLAEKLGFVEIERRKSSVEVEGKKYDDMTYKLKR